MADLLTTLHPINDNNTDLYPNVKNENIPPVISGKDAMEALEGDFSTLKTDEIQVGGENGTLINKDQIVTQNKVINLDEIVDDAELAQGLNGKVDKVQGKGLSTNDYTNADKALVDTIPDKVNKEQGKGLSTNDFTNADKALVNTIPDKVNKEQGKGLSTNDYTNADKTALELTIPSELSSLRNHILNLYRMVIRSGGTITVTDASVALTSQPFPLTVSPKALLDYVGGMCQKVGDTIITAPVTKVVSKGFNLWDEEWELGGWKDADGTPLEVATKIRNKDPIKVLPSTTYYGKCPQSGYGFMVYYYDADMNYIGFYNSWIQDSTFTTAANCHYINFAVNSLYGTTYNHDICINVSNASLNGTYMPYRAPIYYPIHPEIMALDGYGLGKDAEHYNYIDLNRKVFVKETKIDGDDITVLAEPVETDISDLLRYTFPTYDIINVLPGGYLEFENENNIGVPYSVTYQYKPDAQTTVQTIAPTAISEVDSNDPTNSI